MFWGVIQNDVENNADIIRTLGHDTSGVTVVGHWDTGTIPVWEIMPRVGLIEYKEYLLTSHTSEPLVSVLRETGVYPTATAHAEPDDDPEDIYSCQSTVHSSALDSTLYTYCDRPWGHLSVHPRAHRGIESALRQPTNRLEGLFLCKVNAVIKTRMFL